MSHREDDYQSNQRKKNTPGHVEDPILSTEDSESTQPLQPIEKRKKTKSRGNRKLQRFRAKLKKQGLSDETITRMIHDYNNPSRRENTSGTSAIVDINIENFTEQHAQVL